MNRRTAIPRGYEGPDYREGRDVACHVCEATGVIEDGEQVDVDDFIDCLCGHCDGTGIEPWRPAGKRDTRYCAPTDPLVDLARFRADAMRCKAKLGSWRERGVSTWYDSALRRAKERRFNFTIFDLRAQRIAAQRLSREAEAGMLSMAAQCVVASERALAAWEKAA